MLRSGCKCPSRPPRYIHQATTATQSSGAKLEGGGGGVFTLEVIINVKSTLVVVDRSNIKEGATGQNIFNVFLCGSFSSSLEDGLLALQVL